MNESRFSEIRNATVRKSNDLIRKSRYNLSLQQQKIMLYIISQISPYDDDFKTYEFSILEFCRVCGITIDSGKNYKDLKDDILGIMNQSRWITIGDRELTLSWISKAYIHRGQGVIGVKLDDDLKPYLLKLKENFTQYDLIYTLNFKSKYTIRLYELVKSVHFHDLKVYRCRYSLDDLKSMLCAETYKTFQHFKDRVIVPSVREINEYSDKIIAYEFIKTGRSFTAIEFIIESKGSLEALRIRDEIDKEMGLLPGQYSLWDKLVEKGCVLPEAEKSDPL